MSVYVVNIILLLIGDSFWKRTRVCSNPRKAFCIQATIQWILLSGLRSIRVGADTERYKVLFEQVQSMSFEDIFTNFKEFLGGSTIFKDYGYTVFQKLVQVFMSDYQTYLLFVAVIVFIPLGVWIYRNSSNVLLSYVLFSSLFYSFFAVTGIRQSIVTAIVVFLGEELLKKKKWLAYILLVLALALIHKSAVILLIYLYIHKKKITSTYIYFSITAVCACWVFKTPLISFLSAIIGYNDYAEQLEGAGAHTFTALYMIIFVLVVVLRKRLIELSDSLHVYINAIIVGACILPMVSINPSAMRGVQYFSVYLMLILPEIINVFIKKSQRGMASYICMLALVLQMMGNNPYYTFFWQI